jgi:osmoprotectant transport system permease protein
MSSMKILKFTAALAMAVLIESQALASEKVIRIASKNFTESYILAEIIAQYIEGQFHIRVERKHGLGGTLICFEALKNGEIDLYPEYSGTIEQVILKSRERMPYSQIQKEVDRRFQMSFLEHLGFNNTYALAVRKDFSLKHRIHQYSDLKRAPDIQVGFSHEFMERKDGWPGLKKTYHFTLSPHRMQHSLTYEAIKSGKIDLTDAYSTDAKISRYGLVILKDDKQFFPLYLAAPLVRKELLREFPGLSQLLNKFHRLIDDKTMSELNAQVEIEKKTYFEVAQNFLIQKNLSGVISSEKSWWSILLHRTFVHMGLTVIALVGAIFLAVPLGVLIYKTNWLARPVLSLAGIIQTIPSIALLAFMIPVFGIGAAPAIAALFVYSLLPIVRNTYTALQSIDTSILNASVGIGLEPWERIRFVQIPISTGFILAGVRTAAVINIGTATLAAFIGAGGLGEPIITGLALNNTTLILEGAIPAALLAILTEFIFEAIEGFVTPRGLRIKSLS